MDYALLDTQTYFCTLKGRNDLALEIAKRSVISAPSEFSTWSRLVETYIGLEKYEMALLTLNSCPMFTYQDRDLPPMPNPDRIHLPILAESQCEEIDDPPANSEVDLVNPALRKLVAANFKGTFNKAYTLLTMITKQIGWDRLLRVRSQVFVMEEEYRQERQGGPRPTIMNLANGGASPGPTEDGASPSASTTAINGTESPLSKPGQAVPNEGAHAGGENAEAAEPDADDDTYVSFRHKRLCERWLDNLFMVLYEDLRVFTIWRTEVSQYKSQQTQYKKSAEEWEIFASLAQRLHYNEEAFEAWQQCLSLRFNPKALSGVMSRRDTEGKTRDVVSAVIRLICWQYRWYSEVSLSCGFR